MEKAPINWTNMLLFSLTPLLAVTLVPLYGYLDGYDLYEWLVFLGMMLFCGLSITAGYHRMWSHKAYKGHPFWIDLRIGGACALQNDVMHWASDHRRHHRHVDQNDKDPTPLAEDSGFPISAGFCGTMTVARRTFQTSRTYSEIR